MPRRPDALLDTSAAVALVIADHDAHAATWDAMHSGGERADAQHIGQWEITDLPNLGDTPGGMLGE